MKFNLSNFRKVSETPVHAVLMHPTGHQIIIHKPSLEPHLKTQLAKLPNHFADGGDVNSDQSVNELMNPIDQSQPNSQPLRQFAQSTIGDEAAEPGHDELRPSMDLLDILPPDQLAALGAGMGKLAAGKGMSMLPLVAGAIRQTPTGRILGTVGEDALNMGKSAVENDLAKQAMDQGFYSTQKAASNTVSKPIKQGITKAQQKSMLGIKPGEMQVFNTQELNPPEPEPSWFDQLKSNLENRFGYNQPKGGVINKNSVSKQGDNLIIDTYGRGDVANAATTVGGQDTSTIKDWNKPEPFPSDFNKIQQAVQNHDGPIILGNKSDPMMMDIEYGVTKNLLDSMQGKDVTVRTRSDLIANDDYIDALKKNNSTVQMIFPTMPKDLLDKGVDPNSFVRNVEPGAPSIQLRMQAIQKLKDNGINVQIINHEVPKKAMGYYYDPKYKGENYADGGQVDNDNSINAIMDTGTEPPDNSSASSQVPVQSIPQNYQVTPRAPATNPQAAIGQNYMGQIASGFGQQEKGVQQAAQAQSQQGQTEAQAAEKYDQDMRQVHSSFLQQMQDKNTEIQNAIEDVQNGHIDPNNFINDKSTIGKVSAAMGLILGGIGGGLMHQANPALNFLNEQINRDVQAQSANLSNKQNILGAYFKQYGNIRDAQAMTTAFYTDLYSNQLRQAAAQAKSPMAQANANQAIGQLQIQKAQALQPLAMRNAVLGSIQGGNVDPSIAAKIIQDPKDREAAYKEIAKNQEVESLRNDMLSSFNDLNNKAVAGRLSPSDRNSAMQAFAGPIAKMAEGRFNLAEAGLQANALLPGIESNETRQNKLTRLNQFFDSFNQHPVMDSYYPGLLKNKSANVRPNMNPGPGYQR